MVVAAHTKWNTAAVSIVLLLYVCVFGERSSHTEDLSPMALDYIYFKTSVNIYNIDDAPYSHWAAASLHGLFYIDKVPIEKACL